MTEVASLRRLFGFDSWANARALKSLQALEIPLERALKVLAHIAAAQATWLRRMRRETGADQPWPEWTLSDTATELGKLFVRWNEFFAALSSDTDLDQIVEYRNTKGDTFRNTQRDILTHLLLHAAHHRGQIAAAVRAAGGTPAVTDLVLAAREGHLA